jgi:hypothetical protein
MAHCIHALPLSLALLAISPACAFDTAPLYSPLADAAVAPPTRAPEPGTSPSADAGVTGPSQPHAASGSGGGVPAASTGAMHAAGAPSGTALPAAGSPSGPALPVAGSSAMPGAMANQPPPHASCDPAGTYGLKITSGMAWDAVAPDAPSSGQVQLYVLAQVQPQNPQSKRLTGLARVCGLVLPPPLSCPSYELAFADALWDQSSLPGFDIAGSYACDANGCDLSFDPVSYAWGIQLDPVDAPWPKPGTLPAARFPDHDADGFPGVSVDVTSKASSAFSGWQCSSPGAGSQDMTSIQRYFWGLRVRLEAKLSFASDCHIGAASGSVKTLDTRAAGCVFVNAGAGTVPPMTGNGSSSTCTDEYRDTVDQSLPQYRALTPPAANSGIDPSLGTGATVVRVPAGAGPVTCQQVRELF